MPSLQRSALVPHSAKNMFDLVNDVDSYPKFLPWCADASTLETGAGFKVARVKMKKGPLNQQFTTRNVLTEASTIKMSLVDGPFKKLEGQWLFSDIGEQGCRVTFEIDFHFAGFLLQKTLSPLFNEICSRMVDAFVKRANEQFG
jgi:ribosome-associated toxin RatA of RatAB toxin-antitoxin module